MFVTPYYDSLKPKRTSVLRFGYKSDRYVPYSCEGDQYEVNHGVNTDYSENLTGLERIAEDLMGKRKWKLYQDSMQQRNYLQPLNNNVKKQQSHSEDDSEEAKRQQQQQEPEIRTSPVLSLSPAAAAAAANTTADDAPPTENGDANHHHRDDVPQQPHLDAEDEYKVKDWSPTSKCMFCVDGKLDEHNNHGALSPRPSDSESSDGVSDAETAPTLTPTLGNKHHQRRTSSGGGMAALETQMMAMAAALGGGAAAAGATGQLPAAYCGPLSSTWLLSMSRNLQQAAAAAAAAGADDKPVSGEQPLDLSSKAGSGESTPTDTPRHHPNVAPLRLSALDKQHIFNSDFRAKPRMSTVGGRRTYTEDELQAALRDIQSGKLGTRRAAVIYGIPRSTLRNKVYKLALERERDAHLTSAASLKLTDEEEATDMDDKELSGAEEEKEVEKALEGPLLSYDDLLSSDPLKALLTKQLGGGGGGGSGGSDDEQNAAVAFAPHIQALLLRSLITSKLQDGGGGGGIGVGAESPMLPEVMKRLLAQDLLNDQLKMQLAAQAHAHAQQQQQSNGDLGERLARERPSPSNSVIRKRERDRDSDSETEDSGSNVILKIPSFRPTTAGSKNGGGGDYSAGSMASPSVTSDSTSPPIALPLPGRGLYQKDVKDLIAKSISQKFQQSPEPPGVAPQQQPPPGMRNPMLDFDSIKRGRFTPPLGGGISVIKSAQEPRVPYQGGHHPHHLQNAHSHSAHSHAQNAQKSHSNSNSGGANNAAGGKGTRPKRGKYRNYDRDSLVEAVRAVQRGEMSVHRAGSYYGVPHSTLEYKVKERHLMRPRKRDPKPNPVDEKIASLKQNDLRNAAAAAAAANEKMKAAAAAGIKPVPGGGKFPPTSPNGIKLPMYDPALGPLGFNAHPFPFWPHAAAYSHLPLDYARPSAAAAAAAAAFPAANHEQLYASQMIQKLHEESRSFINPGGGGGPLTPTSAANMSKSTRQIAESLLDPTESNGLLDGIIRSSLESGVPGDDKKEDVNVKPQNMSNKTLLDQLCRNSRLAPLSKFANDESFKKENGDGDLSPEHHAEGDPIEYKPDIATIELSNDSNDSKTNNNGSATEENGRNDDDGHSPPTTTNATIPRPGMIYLKQELTKPENLKPEMLVRFHDAPRNGVGVSDDASASEPETHD